MAGTAVEMTSKGGWQLFDAVNMAFTLGGGRSLRCPSNCGTLASPKLGGSTTIEVI